MCHETVVLLNQIMAADVKTQHTDVPQFLVLTGFSQWWHWKSIYWTQMNYTRVQFTAFLSHLSQNTKKAKTNKQTKPQACIRSLVLQLTEADWVTGTLDACMHLLQQPCISWSFSEEIWLHWGTGMRCSNQYLYHSCSSTTSCFSKTIPVHTGQVFVDQEHILTYP